MFIEDWNSFYEQAEQLFRNDPLRTRYVLKYKHATGKLVLKVTDDRVCLQYRTDQQADLKKVEKLNNLFFALTAKGPEAVDSSMADAADTGNHEHLHAIAQSGQKRPNQSAQRQQSQRGVKSRRSKG